MIVNPSINQRVRIHYAARWIAFGAPFHGHTGTITTRSRGPGPRNHAVTLDNGARIIVPCGNIVPENTVFKPKSAQNNLFLPL